MNAREGVVAGELRPQLRVGSRGEDVVELQERLRGAGVPLRITGYFGSRSRAAVVRYQAMCGLRVDGVVGPRTWAALAPGGERHAAG